jgi:hypothetical protein
MLPPNVDDDVHAANKSKRRAKAGREGSNAALRLVFMTRAAGPAAPKTRIWHVRLHLLVNM